MSEVDRPVGDQASYERTRDRVIAGIVAVVLAGASFLFLARAFQGGHAARPLPRDLVRSRNANGLLAGSGGPPGIFTMNADGTGIVNLTDRYGSDVVVAAYWPQWSPDGARIAFSGYPAAGVDDHNGGANYDVYVMNADGTGIRNLTTNTYDIATQLSQTDPQWSPDGMQIAYDGDDGIYMMNADGSNQTRIADGLDPSWSPDGARIAFAHERPGGASIDTVAPDGAGLTQLTDGSGFDGSAAWSPDGTKIAFDHFQDEHGATFVMNADGSGLTGVFDQPGVNPGRPLWSPDGARLILDALVSVTPGTEGHPDYDYDIYAVVADGTGLTDLTPTTGRTENTPVWAPDGTRIAFEASENLSGENAGTFDMFVMDPDGTGQQRLTTDQHAGGFDLSWQALPLGGQSEDVESQ